MSEHQWQAVVVVAFVVGNLTGFRLGTWWLPSLIGKMEAWGLRRNIRNYRRRGRR